MYSGFPFIIFFAVWLTIDSSADACLYVFTSLDVGNELIKSDNMIYVILSHDIRYFIVFSASNHTMI